MNLTSQFTGLPGIFVLTVSGSLRYSLKGYIRVTIEILVDVSERVLDALGIAHFSNLLEQPGTDGRRDRTLR